MPANQNFAFKGTLDEANDMREALEDKLATLRKIGVALMTDAQRAQAGRIEATLRLQFGSRV